MAKQRGDTTSIALRDFCGYSLGEWIVDGKERTVDISKYQRYKPCEIPGHFRMGLKLQIYSQRSRS